MISNSIHHHLKQTLPPSRANLPATNSQIPPASSHPKTSSHPTEEASPASHTLDRSVIDTQGNGVRANPSPQIAESTIQKALEEANLTASIKNSSLVRELLQNQMPIDKATIQAFLKQMAMFQNASISTLIQMNKAGIPATQLTTTQFEAYKQGEHTLLGQLDLLADTLLEGMLSMKETSSSSFIEHPVFSMLFEGTEKSLLFNVTNEIMPFPEASTTSNQATQSHSNIDVGNTATSGNVAILETTAVANGNIITEGTRILENDILAENTLHSKNGIVTENGIVTANAAVSENAIVSENTTVSENAALLKDAAIIKDATLAANDILTKNTANGSLPIDKNVPGMPTSPENQTTLQASNQSQTNLIGTDSQSNQISSLLKTPELLAIQDPNLQAFFKKHITKRFTLSIDELKKNGISSFYERLSSDITNLKQLLEHENSNSFSNTQEQLSKLQDHVDFMKTLHAMFLFAELPVQLSKKPVHSELYVYTKKKHLASDPNNFSILLHLDMESLGPTDIHLNLQQKNITAKFYTNDETSMSLFHQNLPSLLETLDAKGYHLGYEVYQQEEEALEPHALLHLHKDTSQCEVNYYSFDSKA